LGHDSGARLPGVRRAALGGDLLAAPAAESVPLSRLSFL
jgi:hypothetical protein